MAKKIHPADAINLADIANAKEFTAALFLGKGKYAKATGNSLADIRAKATQLQLDNSKVSAKPIINAIVNGKAILVPATYELPAPAADGIPEFLKRGKDEAKPAPARKPTELTPIFKKLDADAAKPKAPPQAEKLEAKPERYVDVMAK